MATQDDLKRMLDQMMRQQAMQQQMNGMPGMAVGMASPNTGMPGMSPAQAMPGGGGMPPPPPPATLSPEQEAAIHDIRNEEIRGMGSILGANAKTGGQALAQTIAAGLSGHYGRKEQKSKMKALRKTSQKVAEDLARDEKRRLEREDEDYAATRERLGFDRLEEERAATEHEERGITAIERRFMGTRGPDDPARGTKAYGDAFAKFMENEDTRYGRYTGGSGGGGTTANVQEYEQWLKLNPDASTKDKQNEWQRIMRSHRDVKDLTGVAIDPVTGVPVLPQSPETQRGDEVRQVARIAKAKEFAKLDAENVVNLEAQIGAMEGDIAQLGGLIESEDFDGAVGWIDNITGRISQNLPYFGDEGRMGLALDQIVQNLVLKQAAFFKGNLNQTEIEILQDSVPARSTDERGWKTWMRLYKDTMDRAKVRLYEKNRERSPDNTPTDGSAVRVPPPVNEGIPTPARKTLTDEEMDAKYG